jgi:hypothetical protein
MGDEAANGIMLSATATRVQGLFQQGAGVISRYGLNPTNNTADLGIREVDLKLLCLHNLEDK